MHQSKFITLLTPEIEERIFRNPLLNIDTFIIPSPYIKDPSARKDYEHSYVWSEEGEILGYLLTYVSKDDSKYLIYKLVTSPFGRGRGIGTSFIERLAYDVPESSRIYLYVWEKQGETVDFFQNKGFEAQESIVYRNMIYHRLEAERTDIIERIGTEKKSMPAADEIGRTRHDARKTLRSITAMVNALAPENVGRIIEDINRETTTLVNMFNTYRDSMAMGHEVNLKDLVLERLVPYVESSELSVELIIKLAAPKPVVLGHWLNISRALVNLASNALDAMSGSGRPPILRLSIRDNGEQVVLRISDNGVGIPAELMEKDEAGRPKFIGKSTKGRGKGEGIGTAQVWNTFGVGRISIDSTPGKGTDWTIFFDRSAQGLSRRFATLQRRFHELQGLKKEIPLGPDTAHNDVITAIWRLRQQELFLLELILRFSHRHNIRDLYRTVLSFFQGTMDDPTFIQVVDSWEGEHKALNAWLSTTARRIRDRQIDMREHIDLSEYRGALFKSYGQAVESVIIFSLNPANGKFLATDRKLAEHLDFVPYLDGNREEILRGEFVGDVNIDRNPIFLGVWSVDSEDDLLDKLRLIRQGAKALLKFDIHPSKQLALYQTTYVNHHRDVDSDAATTLGEFAQLDDKGLLRFARNADDEMQGFLSALD